MIERDISFLKFDIDKDKAQSLGESPQAKFRYTPQIQLVPFDPKPYIQITNDENPRVIRSGYIAYLVNCVTGQEIDCTDHILLSNDFEGQIKIKIAYLRWDFSQTPVYFKINYDGNGKYIYSNRFLCTAENSHLTSRVDYLDKRIISGAGGGPQGTFFQSIRLQFYFNNFISATEVDTYYQISTSQTVNPRISIKEYSEWMTQNFNAWAFKRLSRALYTGRCYINQYRNYPAESMEYTPREGMSNISESNFITDQDDNDFLNIFDVIILPDYQDVPFLASSSQLASSGFKISQSIISIPIP